MKALKAPARATIARRQTWSNYLFFDIILITHHSSSQHQHDGKTTCNNITTTEVISSLNLSKKQVQISDKSICSTL
jgi:hypothetical protein